MSPALESGLTHSFPLYSHSRLLSLPSSLICYLISHLSLFYGWSCWCELVTSPISMSLGDFPITLYFLFQLKRNKSSTCVANSWTRWPATSGGISLQYYLSLAVTPLRAMATKRETVAKLNMNNPFTCSSLCRVAGQLWAEAPGAYSSCDRRVKALC